MRLKQVEGPLALHNGNTNEICNSPKRINTVQNSNILNYSTTTSSTLILNTNDTINESFTTNELNNINTRHTNTKQFDTLVQWSKPLTNNINQSALLLNINKDITNQPTLATLHPPPARSALSSPSSSPDDSLADFDELNQSADASPDDEERPFEPSDSDSSANINLNNRKTRRGIINPNYPGFQHLAHTLDYRSDESEADECEANNNNPPEGATTYKIDAVNRLDSVENIQKVFYEKSVFELEEQTNRNGVATELNIVGDFGREVAQEFGRISLESRQQAEFAVAVEVGGGEGHAGEDQQEHVAIGDRPVVLNDAARVKGGDAPLSTAHEALELGRDSNRELDEIETQIRKMKSDTKLPKEALEESEVPRKKEKLDGYNRRRKEGYGQQFGSLVAFPRNGRNAVNRRSVPIAKKRSQTEVLGGFDVYNIETAMPKIDLEAIEIHMRAARDEERRRRTDREEIRRRLAAGADDERPGRKPSLQARLQSGMNLQICFMNETASDPESPPEEAPARPARPATLPLGAPPAAPPPADFFARQARLQVEARMALAQAKEMARMQMEVERERAKKSPIAEMVRSSLEKVGIPFPDEKRRLSRLILTEMNVAQLQVIVNDLHTQIEGLNESLVKFLMERDDLHMGQDSMLVDIEDLTRYLGAKEEVLKEQSLAPTPSANNNIPPPSPAPHSPLAALNSSVKPHLHRIANLVKK